MYIIEWNSNSQRRMSGEDRDRIVKPYVQGEFQRDVRSRYIGGEWKAKLMKFYEIYVIYSLLDFQTSWKCCITPFLKITRGFPQISISH